MIEIKKKKREKEKETEKKSGGSSNFFRNLTEANGEKNIKEGGEKGEEWEFSMIKIYILSPSVSSYFFFYRALDLSKQKTSKNFQKINFFPFQLNRY